jgi:hypothetical protein
VGVFLAYVSARGHALVDRELYLPESWTVDRDRCDRAGVPASVRFATEPQLIRRMIEKALDSHVPAAWVAADRVYGQSRALRVWLEHWSLAYMLGIRGDDRLVACVVCTFVEQIRGLTRDRHTDMCGSRRRLGVFGLIRPPRLARHPMFGQAVGEELPIGGRHTVCHLAACQPGRRRLRKARGSALVRCVFPARTRGRQR